MEEYSKIKIRELTTENRFLLKLLTGRGILLLICLPLILLGWYSTKRDSKETRELVRKNETETAEIKKSLARIKGEIFKKNRNQKYRHVFE